MEALGPEYIDGVRIDDSDPGQLTMPIGELAKLGAVDSEFFARTFFPKTFRRPSPTFARRMWAPLDNPVHRHVELVCYRGSAKTTRLRTFMAKRIAYGISRTILFIGSAERDAIRSVLWMRGQVERNKSYAGAFGLRPGSKWEETQIEILHQTLQHPIWVLGAGINGSLRGINFDDYRPDLIVVDDPQTDEAAASMEQRDKITDLVMDTVKNSLAPAADEPNAKLVMAITPQHVDDVSQQVKKSKQWVSVEIPCWTPETVDLPVDQQVSAWEEQFPTKQLRDDKKDAIRRNALSKFSREMEVKLRTPENSVFSLPWLQIRVEPIRPIYPAVLGIDPVPPPSDRQMAKGLEGKDWEAHYVWARVGEDYHLCDCERNRGHDPSWSIATFFGLMRKWRCMHAVFDATAYQRTLQWIFEEEMRRRRIWLTVVPIADGMKKFARITGVLKPLATHGKLWVSAGHTHFIEQWEAYGPTYGGVDDDLDASALALQDLSNPYLERAEAFGGSLLEHSDIGVEDFPFIGGAP
jgi:hypothetical protein